MFPGSSDSCNTREFRTRQKSSTMLRTVLARFWARAYTTPSSHAFASLSLRERSSGFSGIASVVRGSNREGGFVLSVKSYKAR